MKLGLVFLIAIFIALNLNAQSVSNDFSVQTGEIKKINPQDLRERFELIGTVYVLSPDGKILFYEETEVRTWKFGRSGDLTSHWTYSSDRVENLVIKHHWTFSDKGEITYHIQQFETMEPMTKKQQTPRFIKLLREEKKTLLDFSPITWEVRKTDKYKVVVRFLPKLSSKDEARNVGRIPVSGHEMMIADNKGFVWVPSATFSGEYVSIKTHRGTISISYIPFKGAQEIGTAQNNKIYLKISETHNITMLSAAPLLPSGIKAKVYGKINLQDKQGTIGSIHIQTGDEESEFLNEIK